MGKRAPGTSHGPAQGEAECKDGERLQDAGLTGPAQEAGDRTLEPVLEVAQVTAAW